MCRGVNRKDEEQLNHLEQKKRAVKYNILGEEWRIREDGAVCSRSTKKRASVGSSPKHADSRWGSGSGSMAGGGANASPTHPSRCNGALAGFGPSLPRASKFQDKAHES